MVLYKLQFQSVYIILSGVLFFIRILGQFSSKYLCVPSYMPSFGEKDKDKADMGCFDRHTDSPQEWLVKVN